MRHSIVTAATVAVLASLAFTGCASTGNTVSAPDDTSAPSSSASTEASGPVSFGSTVTFPSGVTVSVAQPTIGAASATAYGAVEGQIVSIVLTVTNGSEQPLEAGLMGYPTVRYGEEGKQAETATDVELGIGVSSLSTVLPGETQTATVGYGIPAAGRGNVRVEVTAPNFTDADAIFSGAIE
jgi:hypothetical protein